MRSLGYTHDLRRVITPLRCYRPPCTEIAPALSLDVYALTSLVISNKVVITSLPTIIYEVLSVRAPSLYEKVPFAIMKST